MYILSRILILFILRCTTECLGIGLQPVIYPNFPDTALSNVPFSASFSIQWIYVNDTIDFNPSTSSLSYTVYSRDNSTLYKEGTLRWIDPSGDDKLITEFQVDGIKIGSFDVNDSNSRTSLSTEHISVNIVPGWLSILPPIATMILAGVTKEVVSSLFVGIYIAAFFVTYPLAVLRTLDTYLPGSIADSGHASILFFTFLLGGMVGVLTESGSIQALANSASQYATSFKKGQLAAFLIAVLNFFDDYTNSLITGNSMRPLMDRLKISRAKLAFIVDATSATLASIAPVSSWIGFEVGLIAEAFSGITRDPYITFLETIPYRFYPILMVVFILFNIFLAKEFGPMLTSERVARGLSPLTGKKEDQQEQTEELTVGSYRKPDTEDTKNEESAEIVKSSKMKAANALISIGTTILVVILGLILQGYFHLKTKNDEKLEGEEPIEITLTSMISNSNSTNALLWGCAAGNIVAIILIRVQKLLTFTKTMEAWNEGMKSMLPAIMVLIFAWALGQAIEDSRAADFLVNSVGSSIDPGLLPFITVVIASILSFATGTSWGVMVIMFPLSIPLTQSIAPNDEVIMTGTIASILAGSVFGDHCSPIADTTILASMSAGCNLIEHVKTQLPYAALVGFVGIIVGSLPTGLGWYSPYVAILIGLVICFLSLFLFGRPISIVSLLNAFLKLTSKEPEAETSALLQKVNLKRDISYFGLLVEKLVASLRRNRNDASETIPLKQ